MFSINTYKHSDYPMIKSWWEAAKEVAPPEDLFSEETTFIYSIDGVPAYSMTAYLTNCSGIAYLEGFVKNPDIKDAHGHSQNLLDFACGFVRARGFKRVIGFCGNKERLKRRYQEMGWKPTLDNMTVLVQEL